MKIVLTSVEHGDGIIDGAFVSLTKVTDPIAFKVKILGNAFEAYIK